MKVTAVQREVFGPIIRAHLEIYGEGKKKNKVVRRVVIGRKDTLCVPNHAMKTYNRKRGGSFVYTWYIGSLDDLEFIEPQDGKAAAQDAAEKEKEKTFTYNVRYPSNVWGKLQHLKRQLSK
jgi:hypothetical protein